MEISHREVAVGRLRIQRQGALRELEHPAIIGDHDVGALEILMGDSLIVRRGDGCKKGLSEA